MKGIREDAYVEISAFGMNTDLFAYKTDSSIHMFTYCYEDAEEYEISNNIRKMDSIRSNSDFTKYNLLYDK